MNRLDKAQQWHAVRAVSTRKLQDWMAVDWGRREITQQYFDHIANTAWVLSQAGDWMTEQDILSAWPEDIEQPHVMMLDNIERVLAYSKIAETDAELGWNKYRWPDLPKLVQRAASDFRFSESYSGDSGGFGRFRRVALSDLFVPFPWQFGLRGDSFLWGKLAGYFGAWDLDAGTDIEPIIKDGFKHISGEEFDRAREEFFNEGLAHGGMSSGHVSMEWWRQTGLPLLTRRFEALRHALPVEFHEPSTNAS